MSKYYKAEDVERLIENICNVMIGIEEPIETSLSELPTIEVSEDCISREWVLKYITKGVGALADTTETLVDVIKNAPSVVPKWCIGEVDCPYVIDQDCGLQKCSGELGMEEQYKNCPLRRKG